MTKPRRAGAMTVVFMDADFSVFGELLQTIDHQNFDETFGRFQFQPEFLLDGGEY